MIKHILNIVSVFVIIHGFAQKKITVKDVTNGEFRLEYLQEIQHLKNGKEFSYFEFDRVKRETKIVVDSYEGSNKRVLLSALEIPELNYFEFYKFNANESKVLLGLDQKQRYRYTSAAICYVYDFKKKQLITVNTERIFTPTFSPDGNKLSYVLGNNLYVLDLQTEKTIKITNDGIENKIINGLADWVYEEEFELIEAFKWNTSSTHIAYLKFDETNVKEYAMPVYGNSNYPNYQQFKYPKAGESNSKVSAYLFSLKENKSTIINLEKGENDYIPRLQWTRNSNKLSIQTLNRKQDSLEVYTVNSNGTVEKLLYSEVDKAYVEITNNLTFLLDGTFIKTNENDGFRHLYHYSKDGQLINQITKGEWEVTNFYGVKDGVLYFQSTERGSTERHICSITLQGKNKKYLTTLKGEHNADFNADYSFFIDSFSSLETPLEYVVKKTSKNKNVRTLLSNVKLKKKLNQYNLSKKELGVVKVNGSELNYWIILPTDFDTSKKHPVLLYQYGGPGSQTVANTWNNYNDYWHQLLVSKGYIVACLDGRGTGFKGRNFKKQTQNELGKLEAEDQIAFAKLLSKRSYVDANRIGIWGWSYGGFNALNAVLKANTVFKTAIAVAPVTHWKFYDTIYTERFLGMPQKNELGYNYNSPLEYADNLKANLLLVHGTADDNVHLQNTLAMIAALTQANKQFDLALYTDKNHGIYGGNTRFQLYTKMTNYILEKL